MPLKDGLWYVSMLAGLFMSCELVLSPDDEDADEDDDDEDDGPFGG